MLQTKLVLPALGLALAAAPLSAADPKPAAKPVVAPAAAAAPGATDKAAVENAVLYLKVLIAGLQSDKVEQPVKSALVGCLYGNPLKKIGDSVDKVIADNPGKLSRDKPDQVLSAMAAVCGYRPQQAAAAPGAKPAAAPGKPAASGR